jgi:4-hydroxythreonine-4-phosphate dehydrogenase
VAALELPLALTQGDPAGIGPDIAIAAWKNRSQNGIKPFIYVGDRSVLESRAAVIGVSVAVQDATPEDAASVFDKAIPVLDIPAGFAVQAGEPHEASALATIKCIETAVKLCLEGRAAAIVTNPVAKSILYKAGFGFPGHTEFLADLSLQIAGKQVFPVMMIAGPKLKVVPVTIHIPVKDIATQLTQQLIVDTCRVVAKDLKERFGIASPRLAVAGLNPHAGEDGAIGHEDRDIVHPATMQLRDEGIEAIGPLPADTMFHDSARKRYDVAVCMYHDQALIPAKALGFDDSVNVTLGLPFIRTSPDHGTAFGIAGQGMASESSLVAALNLASELVERQKAATV